MQEETDKVEKKYRKHGGEEQTENNLYDKSRQKIIHNDKATAHVAGLNITTLAIALNING